MLYNHLPAVLVPCMNQWDIYTFHPKTNDSLSSLEIFASYKSRHFSLSVQVGAPILHNIKPK